MPATRREILRLLDSLEGPIERGFREAVAAITDRAQLAALEAALASGNLDAAMQAVGFRNGAWAELTESIRNAYVQAGTFTIAADVPKRFGMVFDWTNPRAEQWLREHSSKLITYINTEQREAIRQVLDAGMRAGRNPRSVALDLVGRMSRQTGRRAGGIIGLNGPQTRYVINARSELENLDPKYFTRQRRDKRFDSIVRKAIEGEKPLDEATINRLVGRYSDRLLSLRGEVVGRTESVTALNSAASEALNQVIDEGLATAENVIGVWDAVGDSRTRPAHAAMEGQERPHGDPFSAPDGSLLRYPGDTGLGASAEMTIQCRCILSHRVNFIEIEKAA